jgi:hypothetical protein
VVCFKYDLSCPKPRHLYLFLLKKHIWTNSFNLS